MLDTLMCCPKHFIVAPRTVFTENYATSKIKNKPWWHDNNLFPTITVQSRAAGLQTETENTDRGSQSA